MIDTDNTGHTHRIVITAQAETLQCSKCGASYPSRGKNDTGLCGKCEQELHPLVGGPLGERRYSGLTDNE